MTILVPLDFTYEQHISVIDDNGNEIDFVNTPMATLERNLKTLITQYQHQIDNIVISGAPRAAKIYNQLMSNYSTADFRIILTD